MTVNKSAGDMNNNDVIFRKKLQQDKMFEYLSLGFFFFSLPQRDTTEFQCITAMDSCVSSCVRQI